jgi:hypothetical protein
MDVKLVAVFAIACSGNKATSKAVHEDARAGSAHAPIDASVPVDPNAKGDVQIRVEWKDVPVAARAAPGRTACKTARPAAVVPTVLWGIPDVFVAIDAPGSGAGGAQRIMLSDCVLVPRAIVAHGTLSIASGMQAPAKLTIQRAGQLPLGGAVSEDKPRDLYLPIAGHEVDVALEPGSVYRVAAGDEVAWVVATDHPFVAVTEGNGTVVLRNVPAGPHAVTAWLPARSGQPARVAKGTVNVAPSVLTDVTLDITKP